MGTTKHTLIFPIEYIALCVWRMNMVRPEMKLLYVMITADEVQLL